MRFSPVANLMGWTLTVVSIPMFLIGLSSFLLQDNSTDFFYKTLSSTIDHEIQ